MGSSPAVEPTVLAWMALTSLKGKIPNGPEQNLGAGSPFASFGDDWLLARQQPDGSFGVSQSLASPGWATPYAILYGRRVDRFRQARQRAVDWLLSQKGKPIPKGRGERAVIGHNTTLIGWPWIEETHSWLEPTALAILALVAEAKGNDPRVVEGFQLIEDRALPAGGWNYGNTIVFGQPLRPQPGPTGLALLALSASLFATPRPMVERGVAYLHQALPRLLAANSLGWGILGLRAWNAIPDERAIDSWLAGAYKRTSGRADAAAGLALLLLAADPDGLAWFRLNGRPRPEHVEGVGKGGNQGRQSVPAGASDVQPR
jgi:hypothetical protein